MLLLMTVTASALPAPPEVMAAAPQRIISLAPSLTEIICDLGLESRIVAVTDYCDYPTGVIKKPKVGGFSNPSLEMIVSLKPDLVVMTVDGNPQSLDIRLRKMGLKTYIFRARRIKELPDAIRGLGRALGVGRTAEVRATWFEGELRDLEKRKQALSKTSPRKAVFVVQPVPLIAAGKETLADDAFEILGIENIGATGGSGYPKFSLEQIIRLSPDAFFFGRGNGMEGRAQPLLKRLAVLPAVQKKKVFFLDEAVYRLGPRIINVLKEMSNCL
jgi:iron complex transport system substrate-binding protein